jgi:hypothetical protein
MDQFFCFYRTHRKIHYQADRSEDECENEARDNKKVIDCMFLTVGDFPCSDEHVKRKIMDPSCGKREGILKQLSHTLQGTEIAFGVTEIQNDECQVDEAKQQWKYSRQNNLSRDRPAWCNNHQQPTDRGGHVAQGKNVFGGHFGWIWLIEGINFFGDS